MSSRFAMQSPCKIKGTNQIGLYILIDYCASAKIDLLNNRTIPKICPFDFCTNWTCCPYNETSEYINFFSLYINRSIDKIG